MNRLCIFNFYDSEGKVYSYVEYLLAELKQVADEIVIVVNGSIDLNQLACLQKYTNHVVQRENAGFDGGAFQHAIVDCIGEKTLKNYDEIILCNDSFFGPLVSMKDLFARMEGQADFWGIRYVDNGMIDYLESYFLVIKKKIIISGDLYAFFRDSIDMRRAAYLEICSCFERGLFSYLCNKGYKWDAYAVPSDYDIFRGAAINTVKYRVPVVKKKAFDVDRLHNQQQLMILCNYIKNKTEYPLELISRYVGDKYSCYLQMEDGCGQFDFREDNTKIVRYDYGREELLKYIHNHTSIYIYGAGFIAGNLWYRFKYSIQSFGGFIQSDEYYQEGMKYFGERVYPVSDLKENSNIILALNEKNSSEVLEKIKGRHNIFVLWKGL